MTVEQGQQVMMNTYNRFPLVLTRGQGVYVWDDSGKRYLDFVAGIAVCALGHGHPGLAEAVARQARTLLHVSNLYWTQPQITLAQKLTAASGLGKVFFCNSGAEAVEGALKLARKYAARAGGGQFEIIAMRNSFHGRTYGAISATGQEKYRQGLDPLLPGILHGEYNDLASVEALVTPRTAAILLEPVQGEGGIIPAQPEFLKALRALCDRQGLLLMFDEVQCGMGRTGQMFAFQHYGVRPDVLALAKGLAGGVPMGALLAADAVASAFQPGDHAATFGGNPLAAAAANLVMDELQAGLLENVRAQGARLTEGLRAVKGVLSLRGLGLMVGAELDREAAPVIRACMDRGLLLVSAGPKVVRFVPPLVVGGEEIDAAVEIFAAAMG
jgi:predicted acetylornithine/succinylornithine family transaminase